MNVRNIPKHDLSLLLILALRAKRSRVNPENIPIAQCPGCEHQAHGGRFCCDKCDMEVWR